MPILLPAAAASIEFAMAELAAVDPHDLTDASLLALHERVHDAEARLATVKARLLRVAEVRDATVAESGRAVRSYLVEELRVGAGEASRQLALARGLPTAPLVEAALAEARISAEHAVMILTLLRRGIPEHLRDVVEKELLALAEDHPPYVLARAIRDVLDRLGLNDDADERSARRYAERGVDTAETFDGYGSLAGTLSPELREKLNTALRAAGAETRTGPDDERTSRHRRHDALEEIVDHYLAHGELSDDSGERPRVVVTIPLETLLGDLSARWATLDSGVQVSPAAARRLACDAQILPVVLDGRNQIVDIGTPTPTFSTAVKRIARIRDGGRCAFPRCSRRIVECHHIVWLSRGGRGEAGNAAWLCAFHHWLIHQRGWAMCRNPNGSYTWTRPDGTAITGDPPPRHL